jgi:hypothetical protein
VLNETLLFLLKIKPIILELSMKTYIADVRLSNGTVTRVSVQADRSDIARAMLEAQYGKGCIVMFRDA